MVLTFGAPKTYGLLCGMLNCIGTLALTEVAIGTEARPAKLAVLKAAGVTDPWRLVKPKGATDC